MPEFNDWFPSSLHGLDVINVKAYGALGNASHDDAPNIQDALDAAFGPADDPHGNDSALNRPVYFPAGEYRLSTPLYLTNVVGGWVFGAGRRSTILSFTGTPAGNTVVANGISPVIMTNGLSYSRIEGMTIGTNQDIVGLYLYQDGTNGSTTENTFLDLFFTSCSTGVLGGYQSTGNCDNMAFINCHFASCTTAGISTLSSNALNYVVYGGSMTDCSAGSVAADDNKAAIICASGSISPIVGVTFGNNGYDIKNLGAGSGISIIGGSSETAKSIVNRGQPLQITGFTWRPGNSLGSIFIDGQSDGFTVITACMISPGNNTGTGTIIQLSTSGHCIIDGCHILAAAADLVIAGAAGSRVTIRNSLVYPRNILLGFTGYARLENIQLGSYNFESIIEEKTINNGAARTRAIEATSLSDASFLYETAAATVTVTIASPGVFTLTTHGLEADVPIALTTSGSLPTGLVAGTTYYVIATGLTANTFQVSTSVGGSAVNTSGSQSGAHSLYVARTYAVGDQVLKSNVAAAGSPGWICTTAGSAVGVAAFKAQAVVAA